MEWLAGVFFLSLLVGVLGSAAAGPRAVADGERSGDRVPAAAPNDAAQPGVTR